MSDYLMVPRELLERLVRLESVGLNTDTECEELRALLAEPAVAGDEREAFEARMALEAGPSATELWIAGNPGSGYANERVNDYRFGWLAALEWVAARPAQTPADGLVEAAECVMRAAKWWKENTDSPKSALIHFARASDAVGDALAAHRAGGAHGS